MSGRDVMIGVAVVAGAVVLYLAYDRLVARVSTSAERAARAEVAAQAAGARKEVIGYLSSGAGAKIRGWLGL